MKNLIRTLFVVIILLANLSISVYADSKQKSVKSQSQNNKVIDDKGTQLESDLHIEFNGFKWYKTKRGDKYGVVNENYKEILPPHFDYISFVEYTVGEEKNEQEPFFQVYLTKEGKGKYLAYDLKGNIATYKRILRNKNGFKYFDVFNRGEDRWSIEDESGHILIPEDKRATTIFYYPSDYMGGFFQLTYMHRGLCAEIYNQAGNVIIPKSRNYWQVRLGNSDQKYFVTQNENGIGMCDLNGFEIVSPEYETFEYDGYDFKGTTKSGRTVYKTIHKRPTVKQSQAISSWGGYYSNMPWLMMPGPNYTPTFNINWDATNIDLSTVGVYGGIGDYVSPEITSIEESSSSTYSGNVSSRKCAFCDGSGKRVVNQSVPTFGTTDVKVHCNECGRDFYRSSGHTHVSCRYCGGTGYAK